MSLGGVSITLYVDIGHMFTKYGHMLTMSCCHFPQWEGGKKSAPAPSTDHAGPDADKLQANASASADTDTDTDLDPDPALDADADADVSGSS